jgi:amidase
MPDDSICLLPAAELAAMVHRKEVSSRELLDAFVARVERIDPQVNAVCTLAVESARQQAEEADADAANGEWWGPLHGLPITIKDAIETARIRSTGGAVALAGHVPTADAPAVASLREAGAIVFGKTNLSEWSGDVQAYNDLFGTSNNPWDLTRTTGGSSGGAGAAVACAMTSFELGTDIGGSVRIPAAFNGVFGHKPSFGLIPTLGYLDQVGGGLSEADVNVFGPLARTAGDLDLLLDVLAGPTPDRAPWRIELPATTAMSPGELRVAMWIDEPTMPLDPAVAEVLDGAATALERAGAKVDRTTRPDLDFTEAWTLGLSLIGVATSVSIDDSAYVEMVAREIDPEWRGRLGPYAMRHREWLRLDRRRQELRRAWAAWFRDFDVLLCPVAIGAAFPHLHEGTFVDRRVEVGGHDRAYLEYIAWTSLIGSVYLPAAVAPVGFTPDGLPVGVQVVAPFLHDRTSIAVAGWLGDLTEGYRPPPLARD